MYHIGEISSLDLTKVAVGETGEKKQIVKVDKDAITLSPMKFMDILGPRVKIAKLYDKEYNVKSLKNNNDQIKSSESLLQSN